AFDQLEDEVAPGDLFGDVDQFAEQGHRCWWVPGLVIRGWSPGCLEQATTQVVRRSFEPRASRASLPTAIRTRELDPTSTGTPTICAIGVHRSMSSSTPCVSIETTRA